MSRADAGVADADGPRLEALFAAIAGGDRGAVGEVYDRVADRLFGLALWRTGSREDAAEVVQEAFVRLVRSGPELTSVRRPLAWLLRTTHNAAVDVVRKRRATVAVDEVLLVAADDAVERRLEAQSVSRRLAELPPEQREAVYLRCFADLSFRRIGEVTGVPTFTAASRYRLGIRRLRALLGGER